MEPANFRINNTSSTLIGLALISILFIPFQALFEEVIFRGYLMQGFTSLSGSSKGFLRYISFITGSTLFPLLLTSILFGIMHAWNPEIKEYGFFTMIPQYALFGLLFGITTVLDDGIEIAAGAHASNNIFTSIMLTNSSSALQTPAIFEQVNIQPWVDFAALVVISVLFFFIMKKIYGWKDITLLWRKISPLPEIDQTL
jgi:membrane protease YdiL (CAAX protease family)